MYSRTSVAAVALLAITPNLSFSADRDKEINGFPVSKFCFYGGQAYSLKLRLCVGVSQLLICAQSKENDYGAWRIAQEKPEPCPLPPKALGLGP